MTIPAFLAAVRKVAQAATSDDVGDATWLAWRKDPQCAIDPPPYGDVAGMMRVTVDRNLMLAPPVAALIASMRNLPWPAIVAALEVAANTAKHCHPNECAAPQCPCHALVNLRRLLESMP